MIDINGISPRLADLICDSWFSPDNHADEDAGPWVCATGVALSLKWSFAEAARCLDELVGRGLLRRAERDHEDAPCYKPVTTIWRVREELLRSRGQRSVIVTRSHNFSLSDVILALAIGCKQANTNVPGGFLAGRGDLSTSELRSILYDRNEREIDEVITTLIANDFLERLQRSSNPAPRNEAVLSTIRGQLEYEQHSRHRLNLSATANAYLLNPRNAFTIFFVWQSDNKRSRNQLQDAIKRIVDEANSGWSLRQPIKVETGAMIGDGAVPLDQKVFERIRAASLVIADFTPIDVFCDVRCPNPNVLVEVGYSLACKEPDCILLVEWAGDISKPSDEDKRPLPFDVDKVHRIVYQDPAKLRSRLRAELRAALLRSGWIDRSS